MRKLNPPFRWDAPALTKTAISAIRVLDADTHVRVELIVPAHGSERVEKTIDVPFIPRVLHADCISVKDHEAKMAKAVEAAVTTATADAEVRASAAEERANFTETSAKVVVAEAAARIVAAEERSAELAKENEQLRRQSAAAKDILDLARDIDRLNFLFANRPVYAHQLREKLKSYAGSKFPAFVTEDAHKAAVAKLVEEHAQETVRAIRETADRFRDVLEGCSRLISDVTTALPEALPPHRAETVLASIETVLASFEP